MAKLYISDQTRLTTGRQTSSVQSPNCDDSDSHEQSGCLLFVQHRHDLPLSSALISFAPWGTTTNYKADFVCDSGCFSPPTSWPRHVSSHGPSNRLLKRTAVAATQVSLLRTTSLFGLPRYDSLYLQLSWQKQDFSHSRSCQIILAANVYPAVDCLTACHSHAAIGKVTAPLIHLVHTHGSLDSNVNIASTAGNAWHTALRPSECNCLSHVLQHVGAI